jgi:hypothetical protein
MKGRLMMVALMGCTPAAPTVLPTPRCPPAPSPSTSHRQALVILDGRPVSGPIAVVMTQAEPETYDFEGELPAVIRNLLPERIDLIQFVSGEAAERDYGACPGVVVALITTKGK